MRPGRALPLPLVIALLLGACLRAQTPERACNQFGLTVGEGDPSALFDWLYEPTQWAFYTVQKNHRKMRELILASYPAAERDAALGRLFGSDADSGRDLFARLYPERYGATFTARLAGGPIELRPSPEHPGEYLCGRGAAPFRLVKAASGRWGIFDLDGEWDQIQLRAVHDLTTVEKNAELYRRLAPPAAR